MQPTATPQTHKTPDVETTIRHTVAWRVTAVAVIADARLSVTFVDGTTGDVDLGAFLSDAKINGTVFEGLCNPATFSQAQVVLGAGPVAQWRRSRPPTRCMMLSASAVFGLWSERSVESTIHHFWLEILTLNH